MTVLRIDDPDVRADPAHAEPHCALPGSPLDKASRGLDACVHCGFCLQACPTYINLDDENDSPRGRLVLMRRILDGDIAADDDDAGMHLDRCLGCRACETACPSGVPYGELLEATRATLQPFRGLPAVARLILAVFERRWLLDVALTAARVMRALRISHVAARVLPNRLAFPFAMLASTAPVDIRSAARGGQPHGATRNQARHTQAKENQPGHTEAKDDQSGNAPSARSHSGHAPTVSTNQHAAEPVALLEGCVMRGLFSHVNDATARCVQRAGFPLAEARGQGCCGALHAHAGDLESARKLARTNIEAFERSGAAWIVVNSAGCGSQMKSYGHLLHEDAEWTDRAGRMSARVRDLSEFLAPVAPAPTNTLPLRVTHDAPCHQMHAQRIVNQPLALLNSIPGMVLVPLTDSDQCCGSAGIYNLVEPETSDAVLAPKLARIRESEAALVATGNPGCMMQIGAGLMLEGSSTRVVHPIELLDASYG